MFIDVLQQHTSPSSPSPKRNASMLPLLVLPHPITSFINYCFAFYFLYFTQVQLNWNFREKWQLSLNKRAQHTSIFILKAVDNPGRLFRFGFYSVFLNAELWTPLLKRRKLRSSKQLPVYRDRSRDTEECPEHPILCHWQSCKIYLKRLLSIDTSKTHFHLTSTFWNK